MGVSRMQQTLCCVLPPEVRARALFDVLDPIAPWQVAAVQTTIPPRLYPELRQQLEVHVTVLSFHDVKPLTGRELWLQCFRT